MVRIAFVRNDGYSWKIIAQEIEKLQNAYWAIDAMLARIVSACAAA